MEKADATSIPSPTGPLNVAEPKLVRAATSPMKRSKRIATVELPGTQKSMKVRMQKCNETTDKGEATEYNAPQTWPYLGILKGRVIQNMISRVWTLEWIASEPKYIHRWKASPKVTRKSECLLARHRNFIDNQYRVFFCPHNCNSVFFS